MKNQRLKRFTVYAISRSLVSREITATDLDEAYGKAKSLEENGFVKYLGEVVDGDFWIQGVIESESFDDAPRH
jgi:hypothetical protein